MPVHEWGPIRAGKFHHFYNAWIYKISDCLNAGLLPNGFYAVGEQVVVLEEHSPKVSITMEADEPILLRKQDTLAIRSMDGDRLIALIELVSRGNKSSRHKFDRRLRKAASTLDRGVKLMIIDLHPPGWFDPHGIHYAVWEYLFGQCPRAPPDGPLTALAYHRRPVVMAYVEPLSVGDSIPDMPLFLDESSYVNLPLETTYMQAWDGLPAPWKAEIGEQS